MQPSKCYYPVAKSETNDFCFIISSEIPAIYIAITS